MRKDFERTDEQSDITASLPPTSAKPPIITLGSSLYEKFLHDIVSFVGLGFDLKPIRRAIMRNGPICFLRTSTIVAEASMKMSDSERL